jgi:hypothetical protein
MGGFEWGDFWAAAFGALAAFAFEGFRRLGEHARAEQDATNCALIALSQMFTDLKNLDNQVYVAADVRARALHGRDAVGVEVDPVQGSLSRSTTVDLGSRAFILRGHHPDVINLLSVADSRYGTCMLIEGERSSMLHNYQAKLSAAGVRAGQVVTRTEVIAAVGELLVLSIDRMTRDQRRALRNALTSIVEAREALFDAASLHLPMRSLISFDEIPPNDVPPAPRAAFWRYWVRRLFRRSRKQMRGWRVT